MKVSNDEFRPFIGRRGDIAMPQMRIQSAAFGSDADDQSEQHHSPLGFVLGVALSLACWAALALAVLG